MRDEDMAMCRRLGEAGAALLPDCATVLTHCNAGGLATGGYGTALGVVYAAHEAGKRRAGLRRRDPAAAAGRAPDRLGTGQTRASRSR